MGFNSGFKGLKITVTPPVPGTPTFFIFQFADSE
jgi:hypothetical protein